MTDEDYIELVTDDDYRDALGAEWVSQRWQLWLLEEDGGGE